MTNISLPELPLPVLANNQTHQCWFTAEQMMDFAKDAVRIYRLTSTNNTSKQAASEGDDGDGVANCAECGAFLESVRPGKHQHPTCSQANTSKQAAGEAVAWGQFEDGRLVGLAFQRNEAGECTTPLYTTPPRHPADGGMAMQWPRGVLNRDKTLELLISHNEWRRGKEGPQTDPRLLGLALEATIAAIQAGSP